MKESPNFEKAFIYVLKDALYKVVEGYEREVKIIIDNYANYEDILVLLEHDIENIWKLFGMDWITLDIDNLTVDDLPTKEKYEKYWSEVEIKLLDFFGDSYFSKHFDFFENVYVMLDGLLGECGEGEV